MSKYVKFFMGLNCAGDVLNSIDAMRNPLERITEAVALTRQVRSAILREKQTKFNIVHITDGNALESIFISHLLPVGSTTVVSSHKPSKLTKRVKNLTYVHDANPVKAAYEDNYLEIPDTILIVTGNINYNLLMKVYGLNYTASMFIMPNMRSIQYDINKNDPLTYITVPFLSFNGIQGMDLIKCQRMADNVGTMRIDNHVIGKNKVIISEI